MVIAELVAHFQVLVLLGGLQVLVLVLLGGLQAALALVVLLTFTIASEEEIHQVVPLVA